MEVIHPRCAGVDVSKKDAKVCVRVQGAGRRGTSTTVSTWGSTTAEILALGEHLVAERVSCVVIESTSDYWKPFYYLLEEQLPVMLVNAKAARNVPGRKTDRDAAHLARLLHLGQIVEVTVPSVAQEAARDLVRAREDCRGDLMGARHRLSKLLLRQGIVYYGGQTWTGKHELWLRAQRFDNPALTLAYEAALDAMVACVHRRDRLDEAIATMAVDSEFTPVTARLGCLRGISTLTAFGLAVEIGDWHRLTGRSIGAYLGLVPCEYTSGATRVQGGVTKTGNGHARRLLVEAAWHHRAPYRPSRDLRRRWDAATPTARTRAHAANHRLHTRWAGFDQRKKRPVVANAAIARELAGWCWSLAAMPD